jgi:hypothetical protein
MNKHTPGPWKVGSRSNGEFYKRNIAGADGYHVALTSSREDAEVEANARLIAAAPELLEALRELQTIVNLAIADGDWIVDGACDPDACMMRAEDLIAKATGEQK